MNVCDELLAIHDAHVRKRHIIAGVAQVFSGGSCLWAAIYRPQVLAAEALCFAFLAASWAFSAWLWRRNRAATEKRWRPPPA